MVRETHSGEGVSVEPDGAGLEAMSPEPLLTRDYETRPSLVYERLRQRHGAVAPVDLLGVPAWLVLGYREALQVLQDDAGWPKGLENWRARTEGRVPADWPLGPSLEVNHVLIQGGPGYRTLRAAWDQALRPFQDPRNPQAKRLKTAVTAYADELITLMGQAGGTGLADLSAQFSRPLPLMVASHLLGFPGSQGDDALMDMWRVLDAGPDAGPALDRLLGALAELGELKRKTPGDDFPSHLLAAHPDLSPDELARELFMLLGMTSDHVGILVSNTVVEVLSGEDSVRASLSAGMVREAMNRVVMRKPPLVNFVPRFAAEDTRLGAYTIRAGDPGLGLLRRGARRSALRRPCGGRHHGQHPGASVLGRGPAPVPGPRTRLDGRRRRSGPAVRAVHPPGPRPPRRPTALALLALHAGPALAARTVRTRADARTPTGAGRGGGCGGHRGGGHGGDGDAGRVRPAALLAVALSHGADPLRPLTAADDTSPAALTDTAGGTGFTARDPGGPQQSFPVSSRRGLAMRKAYAAAPPRPKPGCCGSSA